MAFVYGRNRYKNWVLHVCREITNPKRNDAGYILHIIVLGLNRRACFDLKALRKIFALLNAREIP